MTHRNRKVRTGLLAVACAVTLSLAACSSGTPSSTGGGGSTGAPSDGVLTVGLLGDIGQPPDPDIYYANNGTAIMINAYEGLVQYKNNTDTVEIAPRLAESWEVNPTNDVYTFRLRDDVTFHDGTPFTSAAVDVAFKRRIAVEGGAAYMVEVVKGVETPDDHTVVITLNQPNTAFLSYLASPFGPKMVSPTGLEENAGSDNAQTYLSSHDLGTGPYTLTTAETGVKYELEQYDGYWGPKSPFEKIELPVYTDVSALELAFDNGGVDTIVAALPSSSLDKYADKEGVANYFLPTLQGSLVTVNPSHEFFRTPEARVAFLKSLDQESLVSQVLGKRSEVATTMYAKGMVPAGDGVVDKQAISFDADALKAYVDGLPAGADKKLVIGHANGNINAQAMTNIVVANLQTLGLDASAQGYDTSTVFGWINDPAGGPDAFIDGNNGPDGGDPYMWGHVFWDASGGINYFGCQSEEVNTLLDDALRTGDAATYTKAGDLYGQTGCFLNLSYNKDWVVAQDWLTGVPESQNIGANELNFSLLGIEDNAEAGPGDGMAEIEPVLDSGLSLTQRVYATVRERIILGQYPQGSRLPEQRIGEELDVSRVPLREAVPLLERDGFVQSFPRRSAVVNRWDAAAIDELFDARLSLEAVAARYAARQVGRGGSMAALDEAVEQAHHVVVTGDAYAIAQCSTAFHEAVVTVANNQVMAQLMASISGRITWLFYLSSGLPADEAFHDHVSLRDAIASGNERVAEAIAYAHIERDRAPTFEAMRESLVPTAGLASMMYLLFL